MSEGAVKVAAHRLRAAIAETVAGEDQVDDELHDLFAALGSEPGISPGRSLAFGCRRPPTPPIPFDSGREIAHHRGGPASPDAQPGSVRSSSRRGRAADTILRRGA
jgi:hypothetical protein